MNELEAKMGIVKWFSKEKGYGFIACGGKDYFVHHRQIIGKGYQFLVPEQRVKFIPGMGQKGEVANNVEKM